MNIVLPRVLVIDLLEKPVEEKDASGVFRPTGELSTIMVAYPYGQDIKFKQAGVLNIRIDELRVKECRDRIGKIGSLELEQELTKKGSVFYRFIGFPGASPLAAAA